VDKEISQKKYIFVVGLHRSGTTLLADYLKQHPDISGFENTGFPMDEGQFLQTVFPLVKVYGGPGKFGFDKRSHLTEDTTLLTEENIHKLQNEWHSHWDMDKEYLLEKSPPNLLKTRFLQHIFPNAYFILIQRHPVAVSYATQKWSKTSIDSLLEHWLVCHDIFFKDKKFLKHVYCVKYEDLVTNPAAKMEDIYHYLGLNMIDDTEIFHEKVKKDINQKYFNMWEEAYRQVGFFKKIKYKFIDLKVKNFGYSLNNISS